ncbi:MAG: Spy/CpxP family protein refolding chaperone [Candidatus Sericytochromatia bacterium]|nr:Spy/CpxP family protein refolding chaperone [Candidatus Sericytochromatia bacterium]
MGTKGIAILVGLGILAGCGVTTPVVPTGPPAGQSASTLTVQHWGAKRDVMSHVGLNADQKKAIRAIVAKYKKAKCAESEATGAIQQAMLTPEVDRDHLSAAIADKVADRSEKINAKVAMLTEIRDVLTPEQRSKIAEGKGKKQSMHDGRRHHGKQHMAKLIKELNLTETQQKAFNDVRDAFKANKDSYRAAKAAKRKAIGEFMVSGDAAALKAAMMAIPMNVPVAEMVNAAASLDLSQRQKFVDHMEAQRAKTCKPMDKPKGEAMAERGDDSLMAPDSRPALVPQQQPTMNLSADMNENRSTQMDSDGDQSAQGDDADQSAQGNDEEDTDD